jgi:hypothetical protein
MAIKNPFAHKPTLEELQERNEYADAELSLKKKQAMMRELEQKGGDWRTMTDDGTKKNINFQRVWNWIKEH